MGPVSSEFADWQWIKSLCIEQDAEGKAKVLGKPPVFPLQVPESIFQEILPKVLKGDLKVILSSPKQLELFLLAQQRVPAKLKSLMGSANLFSEENIPRFEENVGGILLGVSYALGSVC